jgi:hypothetical protein
MHEEAGHLIDVRSQRLDGLLLFAPPRDTGRPPSRSIVHGALP